MPGGPRLPHHWISLDAGPDGVAERDLVIQLGHAPLAAAAEQVPELREVMPLLERARGADRINFNRRFLEIKGATPTEFRRHADHRFGGSH